MIRSRVESREFLSGHAKITQLAPEDFRAFGGRYLAARRAYRWHKPFFIDQMPNNFRHIGPIHLMLLKGKIIAMCGASPWQAA